MVRTTSDDRLPSHESVCEKSKVTGGKCVCENSTGYLNDTLVGCSRYPPGKILTVGYFGEEFWPWLMEFRGHMSLAKLRLLPFLEA